MSTHSILSRLQRNALPILVSLLGSLLISLQLVLPATTFAASPHDTSTGYTFGKSQPMDLASVAVVRLVVSKLTKAPNAKLNPCSTGLGVIVSSSGQSSGDFLNYVLTDTAVLTANSCAATGGPSIALYQNAAYTNNTPPAEAFATFTCASDLASCSENSSSLGSTPSFSGSSPSTKTKCQDTHCTTGGISLPFVTANPQPYMQLETTPPTVPGTFAIQLNSASNVTTTALADPSHHLIPMQPPQQTNGNSAAPTATPTATQSSIVTATPTATATSTGTVTITGSFLEAGTPVVDASGFLAGLTSNSGTTGAGQTTTSASALMTLIPSSPNNQLQSAWESDITDIYKTPNYSQVISHNTLLLTRLNPAFQAATAMKIVATNLQIASHKTNSKDNSHSNGAWYDNPLLLLVLSVVGLILVALLLLLISIAASRRRKEMAQFEKEQEGAEQKAEMEAQRIRMEEAARRSDQAQAVPSAPSPFAAAPPLFSSMQPNSSQGPVDLHCPNCGHPYTRGDNYCPNCRAVLAPSESGYHVRMVQPPPPPPVVPQSPVLMPSPSISEYPTLEMSPSQRTLEEETTAPAPGRVPSFNGHNVSINVGTRSDPGIKRKLKPNEDSLFAVTGERTHNSLPQQFGLFVVADGMGGHANGQDASRLAIQTIVDRILPRLSSSEALDDEALRQLLVEGVQQANLAVYERNMEHHADMGTTMTSALVVGNMAYVANVGDSRTYMYREPQGLQKITHDHSVVASLVDAGIIRSEDVYTHPKRNQIYRSLGEKPDLEVDSFIEPLQPGDKLLLCSDGLWEMVHDRDPQRDQDIQRIMSTSNADPKQTVNALVNAANDGGGEDNISAIVVSVTEATSRTGMTGIHLLEKPETVQMPQL